MDEPRSSVAPIAAAGLLLLLPLGYIGSYYCLVDTTIIGAVTGQDLRYRIYPETCGRIYWPVEQVDRQLRPAAWFDPLIKLITESIEPTTGWGYHESQTPEWPTPESTVAEAPAGR